jgi:hypothetical protein
MKDWRYYTGMALFLFSWVPWSLAPVVFFVGLPASKAAGISAFLVILGEVTFLLSIPLLGRPFIKRIKEKVIALLKRAWEE